MASLMRAARFERCVQRHRPASDAAARGTDRTDSHGLKQPKSHKTPPADAPPLRRLAPRAIAPARARASVPRLAVARFATESEVVEVRDDGVVVPELVETPEWVLDSPPPLHQFEESPIIVEIAGIEPAASR